MYLPLKSSKIYPLLSFPFPATMIPVSSLFSPFVTAGSTPITIRLKNLCPFYLLYLNFIFFHQFCLCVTINDGNLSSPQAATCLAKARSVTADRMHGDPQNVKRWIATCLTGTRNDGNEKVSCWCIPFIVAPCLTRGPVTFARKFNSFHHREYPQDAR